MNIQRMQPGMREEEYQEEGDFVERCLPKTYGYYLKNRLCPKQKVEGIDPFDNFIRDQVPIFQFLLDQFYALEKNPKLRLAALCEDRTTLESLDEDILAYVKDKKSVGKLMKIKSHYIIMLENALIKQITGRAR